MFIHTQLGRILEEFTRRVTHFRHTCGPLFRYFVVNEFVEMVFIVFFKIIGSFWIATFRETVVVFHDGFPTVAALI